MTPRKVLVVVRGGAVEVYADPGVEMEIVDYDHDPDAKVSDEFRSLLSDERFR